jgi:hypothetical protein
MYILLIVIIILLAYIAFFTPERRREREIRRVQKIFNTPVKGTIVSEKLSRMVKEMEENIKTAKNSTRDASGLDSKNR